ncbi:hypothetical protein JTE90_018862 [Oedothorax gibbosus]|uniref:C2H2-type domain-containing protein n=1 Tax=Oedothorax gibbosus TaxID=931172 RepID=A0AAV6TVU5_9ARAC|nr:hypothetical protein JTE90_018862 [Oedothorax gibbosus]
MFSTKKIINTFIVLPCAGPHLPPPALFSSAGPLFEDPRLWLVGDALRPCLLFFCARGCLFPVALTPSVASPRPFAAPSPACHASLLLRCHSPTHTTLPFWPFRSFSGWRVGGGGIPCALSPPQTFFPTMSTIPIATPPVATRTRGKTMMPVPVKCASLVAPASTCPPTSQASMTPNIDPNPTSPPDVPTHKSAVPQDTSNLPTASPSSACHTESITSTTTLTDSTTPPKSSSPNPSPPLDLIWSLTFSPSLSQKATYSKSLIPSNSNLHETPPVATQKTQPPTASPTQRPETPTCPTVHHESADDTDGQHLPPVPKQHSLIPDITDELNVDDQLPPPSPQQSSVTIDLSSSPEAVPPPPATEEDWTCGFCEAHFPSMTKCDAHLSELHILSQERDEISPPRTSVQPDSPISPSPRCSPPVPTLSD